MERFDKLKIVDLVKENRPICYGVLKPGDEDLNGVPLVKITDIGADHVLRSEGLFKISKDLDKLFYRSRLNGGELLLSIQGTIGRCCIVENELAGSNISRTIARIDIKEEFDRNYIYQYFKSELGQRKFQDATLGSTRASLNIGTLKQLVIDVPKNKCEQTSIAEILCSVDNSIAATEALISKFAHIKMGLTQDLLTYGIDEHGNVRSKSTHSFVTKKGIEVPEDWEVYTIDDISEHVGSGITPKGGSNVYSHSGVMLIRSQNVLVGEFDFSDVAYISDDINQGMGRSELKELDVLLNITGASIGRSHFVPKDFQKANVNQHVCAIRIRNKSEGKSVFVSTFLNDFKGQIQIKRLLGASNREGLNYQQIREIKIAMPNIENDDEFERIREVFVQTDSTIREYKSNLAKLASLKAGLMQDLLTGKVKVNIATKTNQLGVCI